MTREGVEQGGRERERERGMRRATCAIVYLFEWFPGD